MFHYNPINKYYFGFNQSVTSKASITRSMKINLSNLGWAEVCSRCLPQCASCQILDLPLEAR